MEDQKEYLSEQCNFSYILRGEVKYLEEIKEHIIKEFVNKGFVTLINPIYDKKEMYILTDKQWKEYQKLKREKDNGLIGMRFL